MAIRTIRISTDEVLRKKCKEVKEITPNLLTLLDDMADTMYDANGVGLAAPQVGILKRVVVIDIGEGLVELINPVILETSGSQTDDEGCLSVPGKYAPVERPNYVKAIAYNENMELYEIEGTELLARAICHELDHLDGILFVDKIDKKNPFKNKDFMRFRTIILMLFCSLSVFAQKNMGILNGTVMEKNSNEPLMYAVLKLFSLPDSTLKVSEATDMDGNFSIKAEPAKYLQILPLWWLDKQQLPRRRKNFHMSSRRQWWRHPKMCPDFRK